MQETHSCPEKDGADANAQDKYDTPVSARQVLREWWNQLRGRKPAVTLHTPALVLASAIEVNSPADKKGMPSRNVTLIQALLDYGADPNARDEYGHTALSFAIQTDQTAAARLLLEKGADVNAVDKDGWTALMVAAARGYPVAVRLLLDRGADSRIKARNGDTALSLAYESLVLPSDRAPGWTDCVRLLKQHGAKE